MRIYNITQYLEKSANNWPNKIALKEGDVELDFNTLRNKAIALAAEVNKRLNGKTGQVIAVYIPKNINAVIADLAILYSGNAYMNLDRKNPPQRIRAINKRVMPALYLCEQNEFPPIEDNKEIFLYFSWTDLEMSNDAGKILKICENSCDTDLLCLINTSGSTGEPKAVALCHRSFIDFINASHEAGLFHEHEIIGSLSPAIFDIFSFELCMLMAHGCTLVLIPDHLAAFPARLLEFMAAAHITFIFWVPTIMVNIANMDLFSSIPLMDLKMVWFAGEVFPTPKFNYWRKMLPYATFVNLYGPIEITLDCMYYKVERELSDNEPIPLGIPFKNTKILLLKEDGTKAEKEGEICVSGSSLAFGYYNNPKKTAEVFRQNPLNTAYPEIIYHTGDLAAFNDKNELIFIGRKDTLIKHLGYRIELGEIEHVANSSGLIENCCCIYNGELKKIILIYQGKSDEKKIRNALSSYLPKYTVPAIYIKVKELPRNANGKIDRYLLSQKYLNQNP